MGWLSRLKPTDATLIHLIRFFMFNVGGALLPLSIIWSIRSMAEFAEPREGYAAEWLFFGIMVSATAIGDMMDESRRIGYPPLFYLLNLALVIGIAYLAAIYGSYQLAVLVEPEVANLHTNIGIRSFRIAMALFSVSMLVEVTIARIRGSAPQAHP
jgi:uncharacterized membrane protein